MSNRQALELGKNVPKGWVLSRIDQLYSVVGGGTPSTKIDKYWKGNIPWITSADIHGLRDIKPRKKITSDAIKNSATNLIPAKSIIVVTRVGLGKVAQTKMPLCISQDSQALIPATPHTDQDYVLYYLSQAATLFKHAGRGTTISGVTKRQLSHLLLPLPPLLEQKRIVSKIESIFAKIDKAETLLKAIRARNKQLRQVVLKLAFEGKLVPQDPSDEPASVLLKRISPNVKPVDDLKSEYNLPRGWIIIKINEISVINPRKPETGLIDDGFKVSFIPMKCVGELTGKVDLSTTRAYAEVKKNYTYFINDDIIFAKITPCMENGKVAIMRGLKNGIGFGSTEFHVIRLKDTLNRKFYFRYLMQDGFRDSAQSNMKGTAGQLRVPADYLKNALVPIPPINEQKRIVSKIESIFARIDAIDEHITKLLSVLAMLRKSVLKHAFEGRLVPQDPNDEPACKLLEQVRGARHA